MYGLLRRSTLPLFDGIVLLYYSCSSDVEMPSAISSASSRAANRAARRVCCMEDDDEASGDGVVFRPLMEDAELLLVVEEVLGWFVVVVVAIARTDRSDAPELCLALPLRRGLIAGRG